MTELKSIINAKPSVLIGYFGRKKSLTLNAVVIRDISHDGRHPVVAAELTDTGGPIESIDGDFPFSLKAGLLDWLNHPDNNAGKRYEIQQFPVIITKDFVKRYIPGHLSLMSSSALMFRVAHECDVMDGAGGNGTAGNDAVMQKVGVPKKQYHTSMIIEDIHAAMDSMLGKIPDGFTVFAPYL